jgi:hypothetical protein
MADESDSNQEKGKFFYPTGHYRGEFTPEHLAFNANLQEFAQRVSLLCGLETGGKIPPEEAYEAIKKLWRDLKQSKKNLLDRVDREPPELPEE